MIKKINTEITLIKLLEIVDHIAHKNFSKKHFNAAGNEVGRKTAKKLLEGDSPVIAEFCNGDDTKSIHFRVFENGFCLFEAEGRRTVFDIVAYVNKNNGYTFYFQEGIDYIPSRYLFPLDQLLNMNWVCALLPYAEDRITKNIMNDIASRPGVNYNLVTNVDADGENMGYPIKIDNFEDISAIAEEKVFLKSLMEGANSPLTEKQREAVKLASEGYKHEEIANLMGTTRRNVSYIIDRAKSAMKKVA